MSDEQPDDTTADPGTASRSGTGAPDAGVPDIEASETGAPGVGAPDVRDLPGGALAALEAILMVADEPVPVPDLATALAVPVARVADLLVELAADYRGDRGGRPRGFELREAGGGWRVYSASAYAEVVGRFVQGGQTARLTQAALETLAVIAYRQPVTRGQVSAVRGVNVDGVVRTLTARGLIAEVDVDRSTGAVLYGTTGYFLERMGFTSIDDLPALAPHLPDMDALDGIDGLGDLRGGRSCGPGDGIEEHDGARAPSSELDEGQR